MQMEDMEVTNQDLDLQPLSMVMEDTFNSREGLEPSFLSIPSPSKLHAWSHAFPVGTNPQGGVDSSEEGVSGLQPPT